MLARETIGGKVGILKKGMLVVAIHNVEFGVPG